MTTEPPIADPDRIDVMLVEDSPVYAQLVQEVLQPESVNLTWVRNATACQQALQEKHPRILILDIVLPGGMNGIELCHQLKQQDPQIQIMLMSGLDSTFDKVSGLENGADDYVTKPFDPSEFRARFRVLKRRITKSGQVLSQSPTEVIAAGELKIYPNQRKIQLQGQEIELRRREFELLYYLVQHSGEVCRREDLLSAIWPEPDVTIRTVDTHIQRLRHKLQDSADEPRFIETLRGVGYRFCG